MPPVVLTIGHSNHPLERFLALLARHGVEALVDIRRFPGSRKHPHFSRDSLAAAFALPGTSGRRSCAPRGFSGSAIDGWSATFWLPTG